MTAPNDVPVYEWRITVAHDFLGLSTLGPRLLRFALSRTGVGRIGAFLLLGLVLLSVPLWVGLILGAATGTTYSLFHGLAQGIGHPATFALAVLVILASLGGGLYLLVGLVRRAVTQAVDRQGVQWARVPRLLARLRFWLGVLALVPLGPLAYALVALADFAPESFRGDTTGANAWQQFFIDQVLNGATLGLAASVVKLSNIEPVAWYASGLMLLYKACLLNGFFWLVFGAFKLAARPAEERFTGTRTDLADHLRIVLNDMPHLYRLCYPVDVANAPVVIEGRDGREMRVEVACVGVLVPPADAPAFYTDLDRELQTRLQ